MPDPASSRPKATWLAAAITLSLIALVAFAWPTGTTNTPTSDTQDGTGATSDQKSDDSSSISITPAVSSGGGRKPAPELKRTSAPDSSNEPQGLRGTAVNANGRPLMGVSVYLVESASNDPMLLHLVNEQPHLLTPMASDETAQDGSFAVGLAVAQDKTYDLFLLSPRHATVPAPTRFGGGPTRGVR